MITKLKPRHRHNSVIPKLIRVNAIVLYPYVLFAEARESVTPEILRHELVHVRQIQEQGWLKFYTRYLKEYLQHRAQGKTHREAYLSISFEQEAYALETVTHAQRLRRRPHIP